MCKKSEFKNLLDKIKLYGTNSKKLNLCDWEQVIYSDPQYTHSISSCVLEDYEKTIENEDINMRTCGCNKQNLKYSSVIFNTKTKQYIVVGSTCIRKLYDSEEINLEAEEIETLARWINKQKYLNSLSEIKYSIENRKPMVLYSTGLTMDTPFKQSSSLWVSIKLFNRLMDKIETLGYDIYHKKRLGKNYILIDSLYDIPEYLETYCNTLQVKPYIKNNYLRFGLITPTVKTYKKILLKMNDDESD